MTGFTALNFSQIIAPTGAAASAPLASQAAPLAAVSGGAGGILGVSGAAPTTDIFTLLLNQGNVLPKQENFSTTGQNVPQMDVEKLKTVDNSIDALQSVLTNLIVQQSIPQQQSVDSVAGGQSQDALLGGLQGQTIDANAVATDGADNLAQQVQDLLAQNYQPKTSQVDTLQQGKSLDAYRQAAVLTLPEVGSTIDASDGNAITAALNLPETDATKATSKQDAIVSLLESKDKSPETLIDSISRLKNLSAITPLPAETGKAQVGTAAEGNAPLDQIASLQKALAAVKPEADKAALKADALAGKVQVGTMAEGNKPLEQIASLQKALVGVKPEADIPALKADSLAGKVQVGTTAEGNKPLEQIASLQKALVGVKPEADKPALKADALAGKVQVGTTAEGNKPLEQIASLQKALVGVNPEADKSVLKADALAGKVQVGTTAEGNNPLEQIASLQKALAGVKPEADKPALKADALAGKVQVGTTAEGNNPLDQIASLQKALAGVKPEADKPAVKADALTGQNAIPNTIIPQAVAQAQQQNLSQQFGQKKQGSENVEALKAGGEKIDVSDLLAQQASSQKLDAAKIPTHDFAQHLNKAAIASPSEQIAMQIAKLPSGKQNITVQLDPADLGRVDIKLEIGNDGRTNISILAERKETLDMLKNDMGSLQRSLADSGIKADAGTMQFNLKNQEGLASQLNQGDQQKNNGQTSQHTASAELKQTIESASLAARYINLNNLLDLKV